MNVLIMAANGRIARIIEERILTEKQFEDINLTLFLRDANRLAQLKNNPRVKIIEGDLTNFNDVNQAMKDIDFVYIAVVDHQSDGAITKNIIKAADENHVKRVVMTNVLGIYGEVPGEFGRWNVESVGQNVLDQVLLSDQLLEKSDLDYTTLRLPWLNDRNEVKYSITHRNDEFVGVSASRQSVADLVLRIIKDPALGKRDSLGLADPDTQGETRPVY